MDINVQDFAGDDSGTPLVAIKIQKKRYSGVRNVYFMPFKVPAIFSPVLPFFNPLFSQFGTLTSCWKDRLAGSFAAARTPTIRDRPRVRHGILIRRECWPTAKRPQRFLNTRRKCLASVPASFRNWGWSPRAGSEEGAAR